MIIQCKTPNSEPAKTIKILKDPQKVKEFTHELRSNNIIYTLYKRDRGNYEIHFSVHIYKKVPLSKKLCKEICKRVKAGS